MEDNVKRTDKLLGKLTSICSSGFWEGEKEEVTMMLVLKEGRSLPGREGVWRDDDRYSIQNG
jgi:hypothetical protein